MLLVGLEILHLEALAKEVTAATVLLLLDMAVEEVVDQAVLVLVL
jgi:ABC-type antimicrobial peptide transport system ATPase subunit